MDIILIPGLWLDGSVWRDVVRALEGFGHAANALTLPGQGDGKADATLDDQVAAVLGAVDAAGDKPVVVGHSAAATLAWLAADRRPDRVARTVLVGGFPSDDDSAYAAFFDIVDGQMPFPGWEPFEGADSADIDDEQKQLFADTAVTVPEGVARGVVHFEDERRYDVPVTLVCPEFSSDDAREMVDGGDLPELARAKDLTLVDIDSGHWPMITQPVEFARILDELAKAG